MVYVRRRRSGRLVVLACSLAASMLIPVAGEASSICTSEPGALYLARFDSPLGAPPYYAAAEDGAKATATIWPLAGGCPEPVVHGRFATEDATATAPSDYQAVSGETGDMCFNDGTCEGGEPEKRVDLPITNDAGPDAAVESFWFRITSGSNGVADPFEAPVHIVDNDGLQRFSLEPRIDGTGAVTYSRSEAFASVHIPVFRAGPAGAAASIAYGVTDGTAQRGTDYDVAPTGTLSFGAGQWVSTLDIQILRDGEVEGPQTFQIALTGAEAVDPKTTTVTILDIDSDNIRPETKFHHPKQGWIYRPRDYRIRTMHAFGRDEGGSDLAQVEMALRKKKTNGSCRWWNPATRRWDPGSCSEEPHWMEMEFITLWTPTWPYLYGKAFPVLTPSVGTTIKFYTAWSRAIDGVGNEERTFTKGRNWNTFEVKRR
jgi:hypothetical protein